MSLVGVVGVANLGLSLIFPIHTSFNIAIIKINLSQAIFQTVQSKVKS